jgi:hypothetical protein
MRAFASPAVSSAAAYLLALTLRASARIIAYRRRNADGRCLRSKLIRSARNSVKRAQVYGPLTTNRRIQVTTQRVVNEAFADSHFGPSCHTAESRCLRRYLAESLRSTRNKCQPPLLGRSLMPKGEP